MTSTRHAHHCARAERELSWLCTAGHEPWQDNTFRFQLHGLDDGRTRLRFWQVYAVELEDDYYGVYNYNRGYHREPRLLCTTGVGKPYVVSSISARRGKRPGRRQPG